MAKFLILVALLVLATAMAEASIYRTTTVTTYETVNDKEEMSRKCQQEMEQVRMDSCREFTRSGRTTMLRTLILRDEDQEQQPPQECCTQLRNLSEECRCPVVQKMMQDMQQESTGQQEQQPQQQQEMITRAERLTQMCGLSPQRCHISQQQPLF